MPVQRRLFGRNVPAIPPRKMVALLGCIALFAIFTLVFTLPNSIPSGPSLETYDHRISLPKLPSVLSSSHLNPFAPSAHAPPVQKNSTSGDSSWYSSWNWLSPFSSSVTLDESRSLLPPLAERPPIYTYYDHKSGQDKELLAAESELLITWRRAWWAQGFRPVILGPAEAVSNPLYKELQLMNLDVAMELELERWLAWEKMGTGMLCHYTLLPMGAHEDPLLSYLRRGEYPHLTRFDKIGSGLFVGSKDEITVAVKQAFANKELKASKDMITALEPNTFELDPKHEALAYYDPATVKSKFAGIASRVVDKDLKFTGATGLRILNQLMVSHLHLTWQNIFTKGIAVIKPKMEHMTGLVEPAFHLSKRLAQCSESPAPNSCPPNSPDCKLCTPASPIKISATEQYSNTSKLYTIGIVPHPYTLAVLSSLKDDIDARWIRRESKRDEWIKKLTQKVLAKAVSEMTRVVKFKDAVASPYGTAHSLWLTAEDEIPTDLDWYFGFTLPELTSSKFYWPEDTEDEAELAKELLQKAKTVIGSSKNADDKKIRTSMEAWNLADTEAWKFARAYMARNEMERLRWEEEEEQYAGGAGAVRKKKSSGRWFDD